MAAWQPAAIRHKNPGAMWPGPIATKWGSKRWVYLNDGTGQGGNGKGNKIATFDNWVDGICAQLDLWRTSAKYRNKPFSVAIATWSGGNHVESYIQYVLRRVPGMKRDTIMNDAFWAGPLAMPFLKAQAAHEAGREMPVPDADWIEAQRRVFKGVKRVETAKKTGGATAAGGAATATAIEQGIDPLLALGIGLVVALVVFVVWHRFFRKPQPDQTVAALPAPPPETLLPTVQDGDKS